MLSPADADVVRRDPGLPQLGLLLDPPAFVDVLRRLTGCSTIRGARCNYLRYKPATNCLAGWDVETDTGRIDVVARLYPSEADYKLHKARTRRSRPSVFGAGRLVDDELGLVVTVFPNDDGMPSLARIADARRRAQLLRKVVPDRPDLQGTVLQRLRYKPGRRYVAALISDGRPLAVLRCQSRSRSQLKGLVAGETLQLPAHWGRSERHRMTVYEWISGCSLAERLADGRGMHETFTRTGRALAELHAQHCRDLQFIRRRAEASSLQRVAADMATLCPALAERFSKLAKRLSAALRDATPAYVPIHGDFHPGQVIDAGTRVAMIDLDEAGFGDPAADLGRFLAHLELLELETDRNTGAGENLAKAFLDGYRERFGGGVQRVDLYHAVELLRLAPLPFRHRRGDWPRLTEALVAKAEAARPPERSACAPFSARADVLADADVAVEDSFGVKADPALAFLAPAFDPERVVRQIGRYAPSLNSDGEPMHLQAIRAVRYKPGRRCLIEYELRAPAAPRGERGDSGIAGNCDSNDCVTLVGKARAKRLDIESYRLQQTLWESGFDTAAGDRIRIPEPLGVVPAWQMCLQRKVPGATAAKLLLTPAGPQLVRRIAEAIYKLHTCPVTCDRHHTVEDELRILRERLAVVVEEQPAWRRRVDAIFDACAALGTSIPRAPQRLIHRDFYPAQVIADDQGIDLYLLDLDLCCLGDPALDAGNFLAHLIEQSLHRFGRPDALAECQAEFTVRFAELHGKTICSAVDDWTTLSLARHIAISRRFADRRPLTESILELCEQRLFAR